jgi:hypothetical protein
VYWAIVWFKTNFEELALMKEEDDFRGAMNLKYMQFVAKYGKSYNDPIEYDMRRQIFVTNYNISLHQNGPSLMKINHMADWSDEEYEALLGLHLDVNDINVTYSDRSD